MDDETREQDPSAEDEESSEGVESNVLGEEDLDEVAGGDPGTTHPDAPNPYIP